ncbi:MAG: HAD family hydrolase [Candidatus Heimdallarchaeota archaeon]
MPTTWPLINLDLIDIRKRALNWTILLDLDGTVGYSLIPQSYAEKVALQFIGEWLNQQGVASKSPHNLNWDQLLHQYRQTKKQIYHEFEVLPQRHDKRLRFHRLLKKLCEIQGIEFSETCLDQVMARYWKTFKKEAKPFEDTYKSLKNLRKDYLLIILTNNCWDEALKKLQIFGLEVGTHFDLLVTAECIGFCKDAQDFFKQLQEHVYQNFNIDLDPDRLVVVGDELTDIEFAKKAGLLSVRIKQDLFAEKEPVHESEEPDYTINTLSELIPIMKNHLTP